MGAVTKEDMIFEHGVLRPKLKLDIKIEILFGT